MHIDKQRLSSQVGPSGIRAHSEGIKQIVNTRHPEVSVTECDAHSSPHPLPSASPPALASTSPLVYTDRFLEVLPVLQRSERSPADINSSLIAKQNLSAEAEQDDENAEHGHRDADSQERVAVPERDGEDHADDEDTDGRCDQRHRLRMLIHLHPEETTLHRQDGDRDSRKFLCSPS